MRNWQIVTFLLLCLVLVGATACNPLGQNKPQVTQELVEVKRGNLIVTVSGSGNIEVANEMKLTFGVSGRIDKIYVEEGDNVSEGDVLAELETDDLELAVTQAQIAQTKAQLAITQAQLAITQAQVTVTEAKVAVTRAEVAVTQAEVNLKNAEITLEQTQETYTLSDIKVAQTDVDIAGRDLDEALWILSKYDPGTPGYESYQKVVAQAGARLNTAEDKLDAMLSGFDTKEVAIKKLQVEVAKQSLEQAQRSLELTQQSLELAQQSPEQAQQSLELTHQSLELTHQSLELAQKQLDKATLTAPFDGVIASVSADERDTVSTTTTIVHLIDPSSMELKVQVDEIDIAQVKPGQRAIIELDALPNLTLEGNVNSISLLPTLEGGVIVYDTKIKFAVAEGTGLKAGMSATADIIINERSNVLLVPNRAIKQDSQGNEIVEVMVNEQIQQRSVVTGISDSFETEIIDGLREGETVVIEIKARPSGSGLF